MPNILLVVIGVAIFVYSLFIHIKLLKLMRKTHLGKWWTVLLVLVLFFALGYITFAYWLIIGGEIIGTDFLKTLVSLVFFFGAIFVVISTSLIYSTIKDLTKERNEIQRLQTDKIVLLQSKEAELEVKIRERTAELEEIKANLEKKVEEQTAVLQKRLEELKESNAEFGKAKMAMLNLLEDARTLEEELRKEKASVEKKVQERTQELEHEQTRLNEIARHMTTGAILLDINGRVSFVNAAATYLLNLTKTGSVIEAFAQQFSSIPVKEYIEKSLKGESVDVSEVENLGKFFSISFVSLRSEAGIFGALIWLNDITTKKLLERSKDQFLAIASHEMRTPLAIIRGNAELLLQSIEPKPANKKTIKSIDTIHQNSTRLLGILHDFLDVIQLEGKYIRLVKEKFDLVKLVKEITADFENLASQKKLFLKLEEPRAPLAMVAADPSKTRQVISNVLNNAVRYTEKGGITVSLESVFEDGRNFLKIFVTDTGIGISPENQPMIFQKFTTIRETFLHSKEYGSGLGLYISKLLLGSMGGKIRLEKSVPNLGSTFAVLLPADVEIPAVSKD